MKIDYWIVPFMSVFGDTGEDGDDTSSDGVGDDTTASSGGEDTTQSSQGGDKTFTDSEVKKMMADQKKRHEDQNRKTLAELETLRKSKGLSEKERDNLETQIQQLRDSMLTAEQRAQKKQDETKQEYEARIKASNENGKLWEDRYKSATIKTAIVSASTAAGAFNPDQIEAILGGKTQVVEETEGSGVFTTQVRMKTGEDDGRDIFEDVSVPKAIELMKEDVETYGNLFKSTVNAGTGSNNSEGGDSEIDIREMAQNPEQYMKRRKELLKAGSA